MRRRRHELAAAFGLLTRLPVGWWLPADAAVNYAGCVWAYPVVGAAVGALGGGVFWLASWLGMAPALTAGWALAALVLLTGGFHEDGLADTADGFGGGRTRERKLEIMRDSRIGSYGALALVLSVGIRAAALATMAAPVAGMIAAAALGRAGMVMLLVGLRPARPDGLAASLGSVPLAPAAVGLVMALGVVLLVLGGPGALRAIVPALAGIGAMALLARRQIGGYSGDVLGATEIVVECLVLSSLAA